MIIVLYQAEAFAAGQSYADIWDLRHAGLAAADPRVMYWTNPNPYRTTPTEPEDMHDGVEESAQPCQDGRASFGGRRKVVRFLKSSAWVLGLLAAQVIATQQAAAQQVNVVIQNLQSRTIYVAFTLGAGQQPGSINWGNCSGYVSGNQAALPPQANCSTVVASASGSSRFCAATSAMATPNCYLAQTNHWTMIETTFGAGTTNCYPAQASCVWYDVSLIPPNCTDTLWQSQNYCSNTGGAAYNLPVQLSCANQPTYTCQGPPGSIYGNSGYPTNCGNPNATCTGNTQNCVNAYFHPMFVPPWNKYQPNAQCPAGSTLQIRFLPGS